MGEVKWSGFACPLVDVAAAAAGVELSAETKRVAAVSMINALRGDNIMMKP